MDLLGGADFICVGFAVDAQATRYHSESDEEHSDSDFTEEDGDKAAARSKVRRSCRASGRRKSAKGNRGVAEDGAQLAAAEGVMGEGGVSGATGRGVKVIENVCFVCRRPGADITCLAAGCPKVRVSPSRISSPRV